MSSLMIPPEGTPPASVAVAILGRRGTDLSDTIAAVRSQVYETLRIIVVGGDANARHAATAFEVEWTASTGAVLDASRDASYLWFVTEGTQPRPDALGALVRESARLDAAIAGSKILDVANPDRLLSAGFATDVFETPYTGFDEDERDQGQYDVVRDVAAVGGHSTLVRADLARGLGGPDPAMPRLSGSVDFCQRARMRGARVVVVPSSEVLASDDSASIDRWRERAGRIRAMIKVYGPITLAWALPLAFLSGLAQSFLSLFLGRWRFFHWLRAWLWNLAKLPGTIRERRSARRGRVVGDGELFRYQIGGSVALKKVFTELSEAVRDRLPGEDRLSVEALGEELRRPSFVVGIVAFAFVFIATRSIWAVGLPAVGYSLPFSESGPAAMSAYAGGWNPAGLGSIEPLRPFIGFAGLVQVILFDDRRFAEFALVAGSWLMGIWGTVRLLRTWGVRAVAGTLAGVVLVAGAGAQAVAQDTAVGWAAALAFIPWTMRFALAPMAGSWLGRIGRVLAVAALLGFIAVLSPLGVLVPASLLLLWALLNLTDATAWRAVLVSVLGAVLAIPVLLPWLTIADLEQFATSGDAFWVIPTVTGTAAAVAAALTLIAAPHRLALLAGWGAIVVAIGAFLARSFGLGAGREVGSAGRTLVAIGLALIVGATFEAITRVREIGGWRRIVAGVSVAAAVFLVATVAVTLPGGRAGYPADEYRGAFAFTAARPGDPSASRILVVGAPGELPGDNRIIAGAAYRLVSAPMPASWETYLHEPLSGDEAFAGTLQSIIEGETNRAGGLLAPYGIRWIVILSDGERDTFAEAWRNVFAGQLDLVPLGGGLANTTFENEADHAVRAVSDSGTEWTRTGTGYEGKPEFGTGLEIRDNANARWGPGEWEQVSWANKASASAGWVGFDPIGDRRSLAIVAAGWMILLVGAAWAGRRFG
ncbi:MAG: hypothetical protein ABFR89_07225 [Actinomycetota bacterium]